jgi:3-oxoacyl-(acyl-carrier-protein) synthase III
MPKAHISSIRHYHDHEYNKPLLYSFSERASNLLRDSCIVNPARILAMTGGIGTRIVTNDELSRRLGIDANKIHGLAGVNTRGYFESEGDMEAVVLDGCVRLLENAGEVGLKVGAILVATGTNAKMMPSRACRLSAQLSEKGLVKFPMAFDFSATCSGFIYGLQLATGLLQASPDQLILLITAEAISAYMKDSDIATNVVFGDGWSASLIGGADYTGHYLFDVLSTVCRSKSDPSESLLYVQDGQIAMSGSQVFLEAARAMPAILIEACIVAGLGLNDLNLIVPHQANSRIIEAIARKIPEGGPRVHSQIATNGNTSASSIPLCLVSLLNSAELCDGHTLGLCAFGGGYTIGGSVLKVRNPFYSTY